MRIPRPKSLDFWSNIFLGPKFFLCFCLCVKDMKNPIFKQFRRTWGPTHSGVFITLLGTNISPKCTFESMSFLFSPGGICTRPLEGNLNEPRKPTTPSTWLGDVGKGRRVEGHVFFRKEGPLIHWGFHHF